MSVGSFTHVVEVVVHYVLFILGSSNLRKRYFFASARLVDIVAEFVNILLGGMRRTRSRAFHTGRASCIQHPEGTRRCNPGPGRLSNTFIDSLELSEK